MAEATEFALSDDVIALSGARGTICDIRSMSNGAQVYSVVDDTGAVRYYTLTGIKKLL